MEKKLTSKELLADLLKTAHDPFTSDEKIMDIERILRSSSNFGGSNHLILAESYLNPEKSPFRVTRKEALEQIQKAIDEGNHLGYYYRYLLSADPQEKRSALLVSSYYGHPQALLAIADCYRKGILFEKDLAKAYGNYRIAANKGEQKGYLGMVLVDIERGEIRQEKKDYEEAMEKGFSLPGVVI